MVFTIFSFGFTNNINGNKQLTENNNILNTQKIITASMSTTRDYNPAYPSVTKQINISKSHYYREDAYDVTDEKYSKEYTINILDWERDFNTLLHNWGSMTNDAMKHLEENDNLDDFGWSRVILLFLNTFPLKH